MHTLTLKCKNKFIFCCLAWDNAEAHSGFVQSELRAYSSRLCAYHLSVAQTTKSFRWLTCTFNFANNLIGNRLCVCSSETTHWFLLFSMPIYCRLPSCFRWNWWLTMMMKMTMTITKWIFDEQMFWLNSDNFEMFHSLCSLCVCLPYPHSLALSRPFYISDSESLSLSLTIPCV